ncbi:MAG: hypothetical protein AB7L66_03505 [Gemmatimonadales bacterium]
MSTEQWQAKSERGEEYNNTYGMVYWFARGNAVRVTECGDTDLVRRMPG